MKLKDAIYLGIIGLLVLFLVFRKPTPILDQGQQKKIDSITHVITVKKDSIQVIENQNKNLYLKIDSLQKLLSHNNKKTETIYEEYQKKISVVDSYDVSELERFFTERYSEKGQPDK